MTTALARILTTPLKATERGGMSSVRVAADSFHVAIISAGMNDQAAYARLFAAAPDLFAALKAIVAEIHPAHGGTLGAIRKIAVDAIAKMESPGS